MDRLTAGGKRRGNDVLHIQVAVRRARRTNADGLVRDLRVQRLAVGLGVNGHRNHAQIAAGLNDADRDLTAVCNQYFLKHAFPCLSP